MDTTDFKLLGVFCHYRARRTGLAVGRLILAPSVPPTTEVRHIPLLRETGCSAWDSPYSGTAGVYTYSFGWARCLRQAKELHRGLSSPAARVSFRIWFYSLEYFRIAFVSGMDMGMGMGGKIQKQKPTGEKRTRLTAQHSTANCGAEDI